jgi:hypothetical protein
MARTQRNKATMGHLGLLKVNTVKNKLNPILTFLKNFLFLFNPIIILDNFFLPILV